MTLAVQIAAGAVALLHFYFMYLEMVVWTTPRGLKIFNQTAEQARGSAVLAKNQGLYNGFLGAGLVWSLLQPNPEFARQIQIFFFLCVIAAGVYGGATVSKKIMAVQAVPAAIGLLLIFLRLGFRRLSTPPGTGPNSPIRRRTAGIESAVRWTPWIHFAPAGWRTNVEISAGRSRAPRTLPRW